MPYYQACFALPHTLSHEKFLLQDRGLHFGQGQKYANNCHSHSMAAHQSLLLDQCLLIPLHHTCVSLLRNLAPDLTPLWVQKTDYSLVLSPDCTRHILFYAQSHLAHATTSTLDDQSFFYALSRDGQKTALSTPPDTTFAPHPWASWSALATIAPDGTCAFQALHINIHPSFLQTHLDATFFFAQQPQALHQHFHLYEKQVQLQTISDRKKKAQLAIDTNQKKFLMRIQALRQRFLAQQPHSTHPYHEPVADAAPCTLSHASTAFESSGNSNQRSARPIQLHYRTLFSTLSAYTQTFTNGIHTGLRHVTCLPLWQQCYQFVTRSLPNRISRWLLFLLAPCLTILLLRSLCRMVLMRTLHTQYARFATHFFHVRYFPTYLFRLTRKANLLRSCYFSRFCAHSPTLRQNVFFTPKPTLVPTCPTRPGSSYSCSVRLR